MAKGKALRAGLKFIGKKLTKAKSPAVGARGGAKLPAQTTVAASKKAAADAVAKQAAAKTRRAAGKGLGTIKPKPNAFKGVQSAGAARNAPARAARGNKILAGTAAALGAAAVYNKNKSSANSAASPTAVAPKKKTTNVVNPPKAKPVKKPTNVVMPRKAAPKAKAATKAKVAPKKAALKAKAKPRAASFTPTNKKTPLSASISKKNTGYVKSKRSLRGGLRSRGR